MSSKSTLFKTSKAKQTKGPSSTPSTTLRKKVLMQNAASTQKEEPMAQSFVDVRTPNFESELTFMVQSSPTISKPSVITQETQAENADPDDNSSATMDMEAELDILEPATDKANGNGYEIEEKLTNISSQAYEAIQHIKDLHSAFERIMNREQTHVTQPQVLEYKNSFLESQLNSISILVTETKHLIKELQSRPNVIKQTEEVQSEQTKIITDTLTQQINKMIIELNDIKELELSQIACQGNPGIGAELIMVEIREKLSEILNQCCGTATSTNTPATNIAEGIISKKTDRKADIIKESTPPGAPTRSYAEVLARPHFALIVESADPRHTSDDVAKTVKSHVDVVELGLGVNNVRKIKNQKIIISCDSEDDRSKLQEAIKNSDQKLTAAKTVSKQPLLKLVGVINDLDNSKIADAKIDNRSKPVKSAVVVIDPNILIIEDSKFITENTVGVIIVNKNNSIGLISIYWEDYENIENYIQQLNTIIKNMNTPFIIIGGDCNCNSQWWGCDNEDARGILLSEFLAEASLEIINEGRTPTFYTIRQGAECKSIVDITVCSVPTMTKILNWTVNPNIVTTSDHRAITFDICIGPEETRKGIRKSTRIYNSTKADWNRFNKELITNLENEGLNTKEVTHIQTGKYLEDAILKLNKCITKACDKSMPKLTNTKFIKKIKWWNNELDLKKKKVIRLRRKIRHANENRKPYIIDDYLRALSDYKETILRTKTNSWKEYCTGQSRETMWDKFYRISKLTDFHLNEEMLKDSDGNILDPFQSADLLANTFYPADNIDNDTEYHTRIREDTNTIESQIKMIKQSTEFTPFTTYEISTVIENIRPSKAPGLDGFTADICNASKNSIEPDS
ncbi:unnamed protein product [Parnassius apollo]|uniref:(apollo) hypothetical protein n=1 Tax=Parnassius apollo TaxID=110799 RepID=A0A8S3W7G7_PARAO|nr:unnamed protein product [Parnassius apollo]